MEMKWPSFLFGECLYKQAGLLILAILLIAIPTPFYLPSSLSPYINNIGWLLAFTTLILFVAHLARIDIDLYASIIGSVLLFTYALVLVVSFIDEWIKAGGIVVKMFATIVTYYAVVVLAYQARRLTAMKRKTLIGLLFALLWFAFYFIGISQLR